MVESSLSTFEVFCEHHDAASLSADQGYLRLYEETVRIYASFASITTQPTKNGPSRPVAMRWRGAGLQALKSVASSEALASVAGRQLDVIMPALLGTVWTEDHEYLAVLIHKMRLEEKVDSEKLVRRRTSIATVATAETAGDANPLALTGSAADADRLAEEDIGVLAMQCLKLIYTGHNRSQLRAAAIATIRFIEERAAATDISVKGDLQSDDDKDWSATIFVLFTRWVAVQDRYVILVTVMDSLVRSQVNEDSLPLQLILAKTVGTLLRSDINLIGLSVMDVLLGLIQHVLRILQLGGIGAHLQQTDFGSELFSLKGSSNEPSPKASVTSNIPTEAVTTPSTPRIELLRRLQHCIGDLATHVYYADQISDMISAILLRLKPPTTSPLSNPAAAIENPEAAAEILQISGNLTEDPNTDGFFSFDTAKVTALNSIKAIINVANRRGKVAGAVTLGRNRVNLKVWEGTQWLLRDPDGRVRKAYVDALLTSLQQEMVKSDLMAFEEKVPHRVPVKGFARNGGDDSGTNLARRAVSNASRPERVREPSRSSFLQLLHLAVYENALQYIQFESDIVLLHLLLTTLVDKLGVNAVTSGLPMIFRLQEDIQAAETEAKIRMGSLCHGYFWALTDSFDLQSSAIGHEIRTEITRRRGKGLWVDLVRVPPVPLEHLGVPGQSEVQQLLSPQTLENESLKPFDDRETLVDLIAIAYTESMASPPNSPPTSPGRSFSHPVLSGVATEASRPEIPLAVRDIMLSEWSREAVLAKASEASKTASVTASKAGTNATAVGRQNFLAVTGGQNNGGLATGTQSPNSYHHHKSRPPSQAYGLVGNINNPRLRKTSHHEGSPAPLSDSSRSSITRVDQLKRVLSGQAPPSQGIGAVHDDSSTESMVSYDGEQSEFSYDNRKLARSDSARKASIDTNGRSQSRDRKTSLELSRALASHPTNSAVPEMDENIEDLESVPPVPPLPSSMTLPGAYPISSEQIPTLKTDFGRTLSRGLKSRGAPSFTSSAWGGEAENVGTMDLESMLKGIDTKAMGGTGVGHVSRPPY